MGPIETVRTQADVWSESYLMASVDLSLDRCFHPNRNSRLLIRAESNHAVWNSEVYKLSTKLLSFLLRLGCRNFLKALASICLIRSRVTSKSWPTSSNV
jgi:hypothetical protein